MGRSLFYFAVYILAVTLLQSQRAYAQENTFHVNGPFTIRVRGRFDEVNGSRRWQRLFDFSNGAYSDNIILGQRYNSNDMEFSVRRDGEDPSQTNLRAEGAIVEGETATWIVSIDDKGNGRLLKNGKLLAEGPMQIPRKITRELNYLGRSPYDDDSPLFGAVESINIKTKRKRCPRGSSGYFEPNCRKCESGTVSTKLSSPKCEACPSGFEPNSRQSKCVKGELEVESGCPFKGNFRYKLNGYDAWPADVQTRLSEAAKEAARYYNCYGNFDKFVWVNYNPGVPTAQANVDGWMSFGSNPTSQSLPTMMHEIAHTLGVGYYPWQELTQNGRWTGKTVTDFLLNVPVEERDTGINDTFLNADRLHFWPYGLNYRSEYKTEWSLINHVRIVWAIQQDKQTFLDNN